MWTKSDEEKLTAPYDYLSSIPGKNFRPKLVALFAQVFEVDPKSVEIISNVVESLHTASLLIDDVEDDGILRRGKPVAHSVFGIARTVNSANYMYFVAMNELAKLEVPEVLSIFGEELLNLHRGQGLDLYWRDEFVCPTQEEYYSMVINKTGGLYRLMSRLLHATSTGKSHRSLSDLADLLGIIYQIRDDYLNLKSDVYSKSKGYCEDLTEGKFSFPVIHCVQQGGRDAEIVLRILKLHTTDDELKREAVEAIERSGSFSHSLKVLEEFHEKALKMMVDLQVNEVLGVVLERLKL